MLSRRNIRIKVTQVLYALNRDENLTIEKGLKHYEDSLAKSFRLYLFNLLYLFKTAGYAQRVSDNNKKKLMPSENDKTFEPILSTNPIIESLRSNFELEKLWRKNGLLDLIDEDKVRRFYQQFAATDAYKAYINKETYLPGDHQNILLALFKSCSKHEVYVELMDDFFVNYSEDASLVKGAIKKTLKSFPFGDDFFNDYIPEEEATMEFGAALLKKVYEDDEELLEIIEPNLQNWDANRVAILDMIIIKMAVCEMLHFPSIPTKVTLNEFVEIAKSYSTDKSKDFINGILDRLLKKLEEQGKIEKSGRGLID